MSESDEDGVCASVSRPWPSFWDLAYRDGDHVRGWESPTGSPELQALIADGVIARGTDVLDLGCGAGQEAVLLAAAGCRVLGIDRSLDGLACARARNSRMALARADVGRLPLADRSVDAVIDRGCLHVIARSRRGGYVREVTRILRPGGVYVVRGAGRDDDELGVVGVGEAELRARFDRQSFDHGRLAAWPMPADGSILAGVMAVLRRRVPGQGPVPE